MAAPGGGGGGEGAVVAVPVAEALAEPENVGGALASGEPVPAAEEESEALGSALCDTPLGACDAVARPLTAVEVAVAQKDAEAEAVVEREGEPVPEPLAHRVPPGLPLPSPQGSVRRYAALSDGPYFPSQ